MTLDQKKLWDELHAKNKISTDSPNPFALKAIVYLVQGQKVLELGCGTGKDAQFFAQEGLDVTATDFSETVIQQNKHKTQPRLRFQVMNISKTYPFSSKEFDVVYAHLSLHYYSDKLTHNIFSEIQRVLKQGGLLMFACKSTNDPLYGKGRETEPHMFIYNSHVRHFFDKEYVHRLLEKHFQILSVEESTFIYADMPSSFIECIARKK